MAYKRGMDSPVIDLERTRIMLRGADVLIAPITRPDDWRIVSAAALDAWAVRQWRELAMQPAEHVE